MSTEPIHVVVNVDLNDETMEQLKHISPRLDVKKCVPDVDDEIWKTAEVVFTRGTVPTSEQAPRLKWIQLMSAGMEHVTRHEIVQKTDVQVTSTSGIHAVPMTEWALSMMLAWEYEIPRKVKSQQEKFWDKSPLIAYKPRQLRGQTVGIVGYGSIGREFARVVDAMGMKVLAIKRNVKNPADRTGYREVGTGDPEGSIPERIYPPQALVTMARECDYLVVITPMTDSTRHLIDAKVFEAMPNTGVVVNMACGNVIDEQAMIEALQTGVIAGALLDVYAQEPLPEDSPLWEMDNVIISPHVAGSSHNYNERAAGVFRENLQRYVERRPLINVFDREQGY